MKDIAIIVLCYNSREHLQRCLGSLRTAMNGLDATAFLVDNASTDGSAAYVQTKFEWCTVIHSQRNGGYSYGNNLGLRAAGFPEDPLFRYVMLLNPDTELPPHALRDMLAYMEDNANAGVLGPKLLLDDGSLDNACKRGAPTPATAFFHFSGLSLLFPRSVIFGPLPKTSTGKIQKFLLRQKANQELSLIHI